MTTIAVLLGFVALNFTVTARRNTERGRKLRRSKLLNDDRFTFLSLPGLTMTLLGFGFMGMALPISNTTMGMVYTVTAGIATIFGLVFSFWGIFGKTIPRFAIPRWMRDSA